MRARSPDRAKARSLVQASEMEMRYLDGLQPTIPAASTIVRGIYENFRRLGEALLVAEGKGYSHEECIAVLISLQVKAERPIQVLDTLRRLRADINYEGYSPSEADLQDVLSIKKTFWERILNEVKKRALI